MRQLSNPIVDVRQLSKRFRGGSGPVWAVRDVSFQIQAGEVFGLFGSNGAGKSTIIRILSTLLAATAGTAVVNGWDVQAQPARVRAQWCPGAARRPALRARRWSTRHRDRASS